jgi:hypothetical protein
MECSSKMLKCETIKFLNREYSNKGMCLAWMKVG